jgi:hypothetical protein
VWTAQKRGPDAEIGSFSDQFAPSRCGEIAHPTRHAPAPPKHAAERLFAPVKSGLHLPIADDHSACRTHMSTLSRSPNEITKIAESCREIVAPARPKIFATISPRFLEP